MKKYLFGIILLIGVILLTFLASKAYATGTKKAYCHHNSGKRVWTYHFNKAWVQHFRNNGSTRAGHEGDFLTWKGNRDCIKGEKPTPTPTPTPTPKPCRKECEPTPTPTPTATPEPTATPTPQPKREHGPASAPVCVAEPLKFAPTVLSAIKSGECADIEWSTTDADRYTIYVGPTGENPHDYWNAPDIKGQQFTFCGLPKGVVDVQVCGLNVCGEEKCSVPVVDDLI